MTSITFHQHRMQIHVTEPGATAVISGTWNGPPDSVFSLEGVTASGHWDALDATWRIEAAEPDGSGEPSPKGSWQATVRFYRADVTDLTVRLISRDAPPLVAHDTAQAEVTMDMPAPDLRVLQPLPDQELPVGPDGASLRLQARSRADLGPRTVSWELQEAIQGPGAGDRAEDLWTGTIDVASAPLGLQPLMVTVRCDQAPDVTKSVAVPLMLLDGARPAIALPAAVATAGLADVRPGAEERTREAIASGINNCGPNIKASAGIDALKGPVVPGQQVTITGWTDPGEVWFWNAQDNACDSVAMASFTSVTLTLDTGQKVAATNTGRYSPWETWSATVTFAQGGTHTATASAMASSGVAYTAKISVLVAPPPTLTVTTPSPGASVGVRQAGGSQTVTAVTADGTAYGGFQVTAQPDIGNPVQLTLAAGSTTRWTGTVTLGGLPLGTRSLTVTCSYVIAPELTTSVTVPLVAVDVEPPETVTVTDPAPSGTVVVDATMVVQVEGTAFDANSGMAGGRAQVAVALSPSGPRIPATAGGPKGPGDYSAWSAKVTVPGYGAQALYVWATDAAGNSTPAPLQSPFEAISSYVPATLDDRLSDLEYLSALMQFARDQVTAGSAGAVTSTMLAGALGQPLDVMAAEVPGTPTATAAQASVNELRIPAEILRACIAANGLSTAPGMTGEAAYLSAAYQTLLAGTGTSSTELRLARGADDATREALAARLGIGLFGASSSQPRPDQLDALTLDGAELTEAALETLFGLPATTAGLNPFRTIQPQLLGWQISAQEARWQSEDQSPPSPVGYAVIVDPDVITTADLVSGTQQFTPVSALLLARAQQLTSQAGTLASAAAGPGTNAAVLAALLSQGLPGTDIASLRAEEVQGIDISAQLDAAGLDRAGFAYLLLLASLAATGLVSSAEWAAAVDVLVGAFRRRQYSTWAGQESGIVLSPDIFQLTDTGPTASAYRIDPRARTDWQTTLRTRMIERQALTDGTNGLVATAEQASRGLLRDALLLDIATAEFGQNPTQADTDTTATQLALWYQVDFATSGSLTTTRLAQATASLQSLLELIRSGDNTGVPRLPTSGWSLTRDEATFDAAWAWMGTVGSWQAATTTFLFAEAALDPLLLAESEPNQSPPTPFQALCDALAVIGPPDTSAVGPIAGYQAAITAQGILGGNSLTYLSGRSSAHQSALASWCATLSATRPDLALQIFWAAPMLIGERLHAAGQYQAALDWLWVVFPYNTSNPVSSFNLINTELATPLTSVVPANLTFGPGWTADLNPFDLVKAAGTAYPYRPYTWIRNTLLAIIGCLADYADSEFAMATGESLGHARNLYSAAAGLLAHPSLIPIKPFNPGEPALPIPMLQSLTTRVSTQLAKLRQGRDIAGLPRTQVITSGNPISQPTPYHFKVLLARAQQLTQQAAMIESEYLSALEKYDAKTLQLSDAQNAANVASLQLTLHADRVQAAKDGIVAAQAQKTKATTVSSQYQAAINAPPNQYEQDLLSNYTTMRTAQDAIAGADAAIGIAQSVASAASLPDEVFSFGAKLATGAAEGIGYAAKAAAQMWANNLQAQAQADQLQAGIENRRQEWQIQKAAADQDALIADAQVTTANDQLTIATDEQTVAQAQGDNAAATLQLLTTAFTNPDLYKWMSDTLGSVYSYFLQQATATARLAQAQLAFERAEPEQAFVRASYWQPPAQLAASGPSDTRGLTGAEQLAEDLSQLDQYAFTTDTRRLNLSQTFSLAQRMPADFLAFTSTGQLTFATPTRWFDQDFPGHYQRLIRQVSVSLVALVPPTRGIRASLSSSGISSVIAANDGSFSEVLLRRDPTTIGFTAPANATGVFPTDLQPDLLLPFEGSGVDTTWELALPPAANPFDFCGISDVLITIDYTALADAGYRDQVVRRLNGDLIRSSDCVFSLAMDFPDQWYALNNPGPVGREATLTLGNADFPPGISAASLTITQIAIRLSAGGPLTPVPVTLGHGTTTSAATTDSNGIASTRRGAAGWNALTGVSPTGDWTLSFDASADPLFQPGLVNDVLLIVSWTGQAQAWSA